MVATTSLVVHPHPHLFFSSFLFFHIIDSTVVPISDVLEETSYYTVYRKPYAVKKIYHFTKTKHIVVYILPFYQLMLRQFSDSEAGNHLLHHSYSFV
jgi:hypothetical protein